MENSLISALQYVVLIIENFIAEAAILQLLLGLIFFLIGLFIIVVTLTKAFFSTTINGRVAGAVIAIKYKEKMKQGELVKESKEWLYPIFEYPDEDGSSLHIRGSSGGSTTVLKYKTGQEVRLIINEDRFGKEPTADDADSRTGVYFGLFFASLGSILMYMASDILTSLSISIIAIIGITISLLFKGKGYIKPTKVKKEYIYDLNDMQPIESFK